MKSKGLTFATPDYALKNPYNITRWMCRKCGLVLDYQFNLGPEEPGWPMIKPSLNEQDQLEYVDEYGVGHSPDFEVSLHCPRCWVNLDETKPIPVQVVDFEIGKLTKTTFFVEDAAQAKVVQEIAYCLKKDVAIIEAGNKSNVKTFFRLLKQQGQLAYSIFVVDSDNQDPDKNYVNEPNFIHLDKYCMENYLLDFSVCAAIAKKTERQIKKAIWEAVTNSSKSLSKAKLTEVLISRLRIDSIDHKLLAYLDASQFLEKFTKAIGFKKQDAFIEAYIQQCHSFSRLGHILPDRLVKAIRKAKNNPK